MLDIKSGLKLKKKNVQLNSTYAKQIFGKIKIYRIKLCRKNENALKT